jgi:hypothetical protein
MKNLKERFLLGSILVAGPVIFWFGVMKPSLARAAKSQERIEKAESEFTDPFAFTPLSSEEKKFLNDPNAAWRKRIPLVDGDQSRLSHYAIVVGGIQQRWREAGVPAVGMRSSWDPIKASFTLPPFPGPGNVPMDPIADSASMKVDGWVFEARFDLPTDGLLRALCQASQSGPLLEPVGLRWEFDPEKGRSQYLSFRNLYLKP